MALKYHVDRGQDRVAQIVLLQQMPEPQDRAFVGQSAHRAFQPRELPVQRHIVQRLFHRWIAQPEPLLQQVNPQHHLQPHRRATRLALRVVRLDQRRQILPRHHPRHLFEELALTRLLPRQVQPKVCLLHRYRRVHLGDRIIASLRRDGRVMQTFPRVM